MSEVGEILKLSPAVSGVCSQNFCVYNKLALLLRCSGKPDTQSTASWSKYPGQLSRPGQGTEI